MNPKCETCKGHGRLTGACMGGLVDYECHECNGSGKQPTPTTDSHLEDCDCSACLQREMISSALQPDVGTAILAERDKLREEAASLRSKLYIEAENLTATLRELNASREEVERLREQVKKPRSCDTDEIIRLSNEVTHWRANAKNQAEIRRAIATRPDLKERAPYVEKIAAERDSLRRENEELKAKLR